MRLKEAFAAFVARRALHILLAVSVLTNGLFVWRLYFPTALDDLVAAMQSPPALTPSDHVRGNPQAKVTVIVYTDFQCLYCARLDAAMRSPEHLGSTRQVYRHFPLASHPQAAAAAEAAECAGAQGRFWEYSDALFSAGVELGKNGAFSGLASSLALDLKEFDDCLAAGKFRQRVAQQLADGRQRRINGTPTFFVNGQRFNGALPDDALKKVFQ